MTISLGIREGKEKDCQVVSPIQLPGQSSTLVRLAILAMDWPHCASESLIAASYLDFNNVDFLTFRGILVNF